MSIIITLIIYIKYRIKYERNIIKLIDNNRVNIVHRYNYSLANSDKRELYARYK